MVGNDIAAPRLTSTPVPWARIDPRPDTTPMLSAETLLAFLAVSLLITQRLARHPMVLSQSLSRGRHGRLRHRGGLRARLRDPHPLGDLGVSAVIASSPTLFLASLAGSAYLAWLGIQALRSPGAAGRRRNTSGLAVLPRRGFIANAINPRWRCSSSPSCRSSSSPSSAT